MIGSAAPAACLYTARHFGAAPVGHGKIDQRQFDAEAALQKLERGPAAARLEHRLAQFTRCRGRAFSHGVVVVDQDQSGVRASAQPDRVDLHRSSGGARQCMRMRLTDCLAKPSTWLRSSPHPCRVRRLCCAPNARVRDARGRRPRRRAAAQGRTCWLCRRPTRGASGWWYLPGGARH
jgi:hypothetical protein